MIAVHPFVAGSPGCRHSGMLPDFVAHLALVVRMVPVDYYCTLPPVDNLAGPRFVHSDFVDKGTAAVQAGRFAHNDWVAAGGPVVADRAAAFRPIAPAHF